MMLLINLILIYSIIINIYFYTKEKERNLGFRKWSHYFFSLGSIVFYLLFFVFFIRLLNLFRENKTIDLFYFYEKYSIVTLILCFFFFFSLKKLIFLIFKLSFFRLHYFYLSPDNNSYCIFYYKFYINIIYNGCVKSYKYLYWLDKIGLLLLMFLFLKDFIFNNYVLLDTLSFLCYYSLFKLIYINVRFVTTKQDLLLDYYLFNLCYMGGVRIDEGFFAETLSKRVYDITEYENNIIKV